jgi:hypothetical protein
VPIADDTYSFPLGNNIFTLDYNYNGHSVALVVVPEPASALLLLGGLTVLFGRWRNR